MDVFYSVCCTIQKIFNRFVKLQLYFRRQVAVNDISPCLFCMTPLIILYELIQCNISDSINRLHNS